MHSNNGYSYRTRNRRNNNYKKRLGIQRKRFRGSYNRNNKFENNDFINNKEIREELINYIYKSIEISKFRYKILKYENELELLKSNKYYVSPNYNGINSLLVFIKIKDKYYSFLIDRRTLNYDQRQLDISSVKIIPIEVRLDKSIYDGTIMDGVLLYNNPNGKTHERKKVFFINDIYFFRGQNMTRELMNNKIININAYLNSNLKMDNYLNSIQLAVNKLYAMKDVKILINNHIPKSKYKNSIKGLAFYPEMSKTKLIFLFNNDSNVKKDKEKRSKSIKIRDSKIVKSNNSITAIFKMKKTEIIDVYNLYLAKKIEKDGKQYIKYKKYDIAYVSTSQCSYFCKDVFNSTNKDSVLVECKYIIDKDKWVPFKVIKDKKKPDYISKIEKLLG